jgi:hypothetical protein
MCDGCNMVALYIPYFPKNFLGACTTELLSCLVEVGYGATMVGVEVVLGTSMSC